MAEREVMETEVLIVGAGPAGLACALRLAQLAAERPGALDLENVNVLEKGREVGAHLLSGALLDPRPLRELIPDFDSEAPLDTPVRSDAVYFLTSGGKLKFPITPPFLRNHGNYVVSLNQLGKWLGRRVEAAGITIFTETAGMEVLYDERGAVAGVRTDDKGVDRDGNHGENFQPGADIRAKVTVFAEGPRGSLAKQLIARKALALESNPMIFGLGVKELWEVPEGRIEPGAVIHTMGWPLPSGIYGGGWLYGMRYNQVSLGLVVGLEYRNPGFDPHNAFQQWKTHPFLRRLLDGAKMVKYGAKTIPEGGFYAMPRLVTDGAVIVGESGGFLNSQRLKGIHLAMKSGMLAAEAVFEALAARDFSAERLSDYVRKFEASWAYQELWKVRNFHQAFEHGLWRGMFHAGLQMLTGGRGLHARYQAVAGHRRYARLTETVLPEPSKIAPDKKLTFDKLTDVFYSATRHEENQRCHLLIHDTNICNNRCIKEYGNPCVHFCPASVYEMVEKEGRNEIHVNASNCVHCKTCDIMDPYEIITWVPPEGGGGPNYEGL
jgi:electron-transferring-flavoprotein dehydrogenase